ncbi:MAG: hypothetical protein KME08_04835 [Aphanothece sp. CMT-3BRIN-NPC111]|jgi:hemoglobin-like flavoprotein|nr:hypothetical protein [Aphanothece sp. CMT-3BRIN-NPC111]
MSLNAEMLEQSFERIKPNAIEFSNTFYNNLFADYPQVRPLFANTNMVAQRKKLMDSLVLVVDNLRNGDVLADALRGLGTKHITYGVIPGHYPMVGGALLKTLKTYLGADWTPEVEQAWTDAYQAISNLMLEGADYSKEDLKLTNTSNKRVKPNQNQSQTEITIFGINSKLLLIIIAVVALVIIATAKAVRA